jgi:nicotinamide-nucleotide amidase
VLIESGRTIALYEGTTAAPLYRSLVAIAAAAPALRGVIVHPLDVPSDADAARSLAETGAVNVRNRWRADLALGVQAAAQADPDGFTSVWIALAHPNGVELWERRTELTSAEGWGFVATTALDHLRRFLQPQTD